MQNMVSSLIQFIARISFYSLRIVLTSASASAPSIIVFIIIIPFFSLFLFHVFLIVAVVVVHISNFIPLDFSCN